MLPEYAAAKRSVALLCVQNRNYTLKALCTGILLTQALPYLPSNRDDATIVNKPVHQLLIATCDCST